jgi:hypothetical protein
MRVIIVFPFKTNSNEKKKYKIVMQPQKERRKLVFIDFIGQVCVRPQQFYVFILYGDNLIIVNYLFGKLN